nr:hypothetical protein Iba_chr02bCG12330 [Ipomoea batatas]
MYLPGEKRIHAYLSDRGSPCRFNYVVADKMELPTRITPPLGVLPRLAPNESPKTRSPSIAYFNSKVIAYDAGCYSQPSCRVRFKIARGIDMMLGDSFGKTSDSDRLDRLMISDRARSMLVGTSLMKEPADNRLSGDGSDCRRRARSLEDKALDPQIQIFLLRKGAQDLQTKSYFPLPFGDSTQRQQLAKLGDGWTPLASSFIFLTESPIVPPP